MRAYSSKDRIVYDILYGRFCDFSKKEQEKMKRCCYGMNGYMLPIIKEFPDVKVWCAFRVEKERELLGWALRIKEDHTLPMDEDDGVMIYVKRKYRRLGIGTELIKTAARRCKKLTYWHTHNGLYFYPAVEKELRGKTLLRENTF